MSNNTSSAMINSTTNTVSPLSVYIGQSIGAIVSIPSVILYCMECWVIIRYWKHFNTSFYKLFLLSAFNNLLMNFVPSMVFDRLIRFGFFNPLFLASPWWVPRALCFVMFYNYHAENFATILTLLHRISAIVNPLRHEKLWRRFLLSLSALCIYLLPILFTFRMLIWPLVFIVNPDNSVEIVMNSTALTYKISVTNFMMMLFTSIAYLLANIALNASILVLYKRQQARFAQLQHNDKSSRLMGYAIGIFVSQLLLCLFWLLLTIEVFGAFFSSDFNLKLSNQYVWLNDLRTVAFPAWFLLWASTELRERIFAHFPNFARSSISNRTYPANNAFVEKPAARQTNSAPNRAEKVQTPVEQPPGAAAYPGRI